MAGFFSRIKGSGSSSSSPASNGPAKNKKEDNGAEVSPLERLLQNAGPIREDGSDKFFGLENFGNTCYCNSIVQVLFYSESFRRNVLEYPALPRPEIPDGKPAKVHVTIRAPAQPKGAAPPQGKKGVTSNQALKQKQAINSGQTLLSSTQSRPEDKPDTPEYKKKQAMIKGPVLELGTESTERWGMKECTFTGLKDIFHALQESETRTGVLSPQRFLEMFKTDNEMFRTSMHQDAHEFYGLVLNDVISSVEPNVMHQAEDQVGAKGDSVQSVDNAPGASSAVIRDRSAPGTISPATGWVHHIFEGVLVSETRCLTCETASQRDETFLDLSIDLEDHSSVTSCLSKFSAEEMLCERNKFHCDHCGGLQEAEKRMKIKKLPKILALHLKRFKYTEDWSRLEKLHHRVMYPYYLRMFNTTDDAEDPDRMYELYAVVVHIGENAYHGHYVSVIKTKDRGWLLFDDEMVEPVDKHFVRKFFGGDRLHKACAYVLFYQETTFQKMREEQEAEGWEEIWLASQTANLAQSGEVNGVAPTPLKRLNTDVPIVANEQETLLTLNHAQTAPVEVSVPVDVPSLSSHDHTQLNRAATPPAPAVVAPAEAPATTIPISRSKADRAQEVKGKKEFKAQGKAQEKELKAQEKARKVQERDYAKQAQKKRTASRLQVRQESDVLQKAPQKSRLAAAEPDRKLKNGAPPIPDIPISNGRKTGFLHRGKSKSMSRRSFGFLSHKAERDKDKNKERATSKDRNEEASSSTATAASSDVSQSQPMHGNGAAVVSALEKEKVFRDRGRDKDSDRLRDRDKPLRERFSFSLGRKKSAFL